MLVILNDFQHSVSVQGGAHLAQLLQAVFNQRAIVHIMVFRLLLALVDSGHRGFKHILYAMAIIGCQWHHARPQQATQHLDVEAVAALLQFVPHVQCHHHRDVHVHQLSGQVQVALQIAGIHDIEDGVGMIVADIGAHIHLLG